MLFRSRKINGESISSYGNYNDKYFVCANGKENMYKTQVLIKEMLCERTRREENNGWILQVYSIGDTSEMVRGYILGDAIHWSFFFRYCVACRRRRHYECYASWCAGSN